MNPDEIAQVNGGRPLVFRNATVLTMDEQGLLEDADVLVTGREIAAVGRALSVPDGTVEIDARGGIVLARARVDASGLAASAARDRHGSQARAVLGRRRRAFLFLPRRRRRVDPAERARARDHRSTAVRRRDRRHRLDWPPRQAPTRPMGVTSERIERSISSQKPSLLLIPARAGQARGAQHVRRTAPQGRSQRVIHV